MPSISVCFSAVLPTFNFGKNFVALLLDAEEKPSSSPVCCQDRKPPKKAAHNLCE